MTEGSKKRLEELLPRFAAKISFTNNSGDCWIWTAYKSTCGYGRFLYKGKPVLAHRLSYELLVGEIPAGKQINHKCDNPACCNPNHFIIGTQTENVLDMFEKGRAASQKGSRNCKAKLNDLQVKKIRKMYSEGESITGISNQYGVCFSTINRIVKKVTWRHI